MATPPRPEIPDRYRQAVARIVESALEKHREHLAQLAATPRPRRRRVAPNGAVLVASEPPEGQE